MLAIARGSYHGSHTRVYVNITQVSTANVGIGFALARIVPTLVASRVGMSLALATSVPMLVTSYVGTSFALARSMPTLDGACVLTRGEGGCLVLIIVVATQAPKRVNLAKK